MRTMEAVKVVKSILYRCHECKVEAWFPLSYKGEIPTLDGWFYCSKCIVKSPTQPEAPKTRRKWTFVTEKDEYFLPPDWKMRKAPPEKPDKPQDPA